MASFGSRPGGLSILITSAPKSARMRVQVGPARTRVRSSTRVGARAVDEVGRGMRPPLRFHRTRGEAYFGTAARPLAAAIPAEGLPTGFALLPPRLGHCC